MGLVSLQIISSVNHSYQTPVFKTKRLFSLNQFPHGREEKWEN